MGPDGDGDEQIASGAAVFTGVALASDRDGLAVVNSGGDGGLDGLALADRPRAVAVLTGLVDDAALTAAFGAGGGGGEHTHGGLPPDLDLAGAVAVGADLRRGAGCAAAAAASLAALHALHGDSLVAAEGRLFKADGQGHADALAPLGRVGIRAASAAEAAAEKAAENVAQVSEIKAPVKPGPASAEVGVHARVAILVIAGFFVPVGQHLIGLVNLLEPGLSGLVAGVQVRVIDLGQLAVGLFNLIVRRAPGNAQNLVIIAFLFCHIFLLPSVRTSEEGLFATRLIPVSSCLIRAKRSKWGGEIPRPIGSVFLTACSSRPHRPPCSRRRNTGRPGQWHRHRGRAVRRPGRPGDWPADRAFRSRRKTPGSVPRWRP